MDPQIPPKPGSVAAVFNIKVTLRYPEDPNQIVLAIPTNEMMEELVQGSAETAFSLSTKASSERVDI